jgi:hypothetical protein
MIKVLYLQNECLLMSFMHAANMKLHPRKSFHVMNFLYVLDLVSKLNVEKKSLTQSMKAIRLNLGQFAPFDVYCMPIKFQVDRSKGKADPSIVCACGHATWRTHFSQIQVWKKGVNF